MIKTSMPCTVISRSSDTGHNDTGHNDTGHSSTLVAQWFRSRFRITAPQVRIPTRGTRIWGINVRLDAGSLAASCNPSDGGIETDHECGPLSRSYRVKRSDLIVQSCKTKVSSAREAIHAFTGREGPSMVGKNASRDETSTG